MKTQILIPRRSAMPERMKINIASNDLNRRLSNINVERMPEEEKIAVTEKFTKQLKNSGYGRQECRHIVMSGVKSWIKTPEEKKGGPRLLQKCSKHIERKDQEEAHRQDDMV